jgi:hypothetical protein
MSYVCRSHLARLAALVSLSACLHDAGSNHTLAAEGNASPPPAAKLETFAKPDGQTFFALKLAPQAVASKAQPHDVVVLFDTSASQIGAYRAKALGALRAMLSGLSNDDRVALIAVDVTAARLTQTFVPPSGSEINRALTTLERRVPLGSTDMGEAFDAALATWEDVKDSNRARSVVYIGDGMSIAGLVPVTTLQRIVRQYTARRASCSSYAIGPRINGELLGAMANHTGGMLLADDDHSTDRQIGSHLTAVAKAAVLWPTATNLPAALEHVYPRQTPPLRFDRDSVLVGSLDSDAIKTNQPLAFEVQASLAGQPITLNWKAVAEKPLAENAYLVKVVELATASNGVALPTVGTAGLDELRRLVNLEAQQFARLSEHALATGQIHEAAKLAGEAQRLDPSKTESEVLRGAAERVWPAAARDLRLNRAPANRAQPVAEKVEPIDGDLITNIERHERAIEGFMQAEVANVMAQAASSMATDPEAALNQLKLLLEKVQHTSELKPEVRGQLEDKIEAGLRAASRMATVKTEHDLRLQQVAAEGEARERINRELDLQQERLGQLMNRFDALMDEERYRDAEAIADIAEEVAPALPGFRNAELTARTVGYTANNNAVRELAHKGLVDMLYQVELSSIPMNDNTPIIYPDPEVWQLVTERRKKYNTIDLKKHSPNEQKILQALDEPTDIDFEEQALSDVVDYLKQRHGIEIQLDKKALSDAGIGSEMPVTRSIKGITLRSALKLLLGEMELTYVLRNEVLMITSKTEAENMLSNRVYPVADLTVPIAAPRNMGGFGGNMGSSMLGMPNMGGMGGMGGYGMGGMGGMGMGGMGMGMGGMGMGMPGMGFF